MSSSIITNSKDSYGPSWWDDDGRLSLLLFASEESFELFLKSLGVPKSLWTAPPSNVVGTYANLIGDIILIANINTYTTTNDLGLKVGNSATINYGPDPQILTIFTYSWNMVVKQPINPGANYTVTTFKPSYPNGQVTGTLAPS